MLRQKADDGQDEHSYEGYGRGARREAGATRRSQTQGLPDLRRGEFGMFSTYASTTCSMHSDSSVTSLYGGGCGVGTRM